METIYYSKEMIDLLHKQFDSISPETWHRMMNPMCGICMAERGKALIEGRIPWQRTPLTTP
jgi:hypothetical protein